MKKKLNRSPPVSRQDLAVKTTPLFERGLAAHQKSAILQARALYEQVLGVEPKHFDALHMLGVVEAQSGSSELAIELISKAIAINPHHPTAHNHLGNILKDLNRLEEALASYGQAVALKPDYFEANWSRGLVLADLQRHEEAITSYEKAAALKTDVAELFYNRGNSLLALDRLEEALVSFDRAILLKPNYAVALNNRGLVLAGLKRMEEALTSYRQALEVKPDYAEVYLNRGGVLQDLKRWDEALASYDRALEINPNYAKAYCNRGFVLQGFKRTDEALLSFDRALEIKPQYPEAWCGRAAVLFDLQCWDESLSNFDSAIEMNSESPMVNFNRGMVLLRLHRLEEALVSFERTIQISPNFAWARGQYLNTLSRVCDWSFYAKHLVSLVEQIQKGERACRPFTTLSIFDGPKLQKNAAEIYIQAKHPLQAMPAFAKEPHRSSKIRLGYYSPDFCNHAVSCLIVELLELHDKNKFELIAFSFGPNTQDDMRQRVASAFDQFIDVRFKSDKEIALLSREMGIDIAIDLAGFTQDARTRIFAYRCAPIQVNYLGFPGTMGAEYIDYLIADETLIPDSSLLGYSEKIIKMPYSFQANDRQKVISDRVFSRQELGLPAKGFVFCCFNNNYKITPEIFDVWMRVLQKVPGSVLWLLADNPTAQANLTKEAIHRGVEAGRLIFAQRLALPEYLARYRAADLFLDTVPFNAGTTASDALWAGLPVLTLMGESFAGRMAASLLNAIEMPELIEQTIDGYESRAIELATKPKQMAAIRAKLAANRLTTPLFNTPLFTRHLEQAYTQMHERYLKGLPPDHIRVAPTKAP